MEAKLLHYVPHSLMTLISHENESQEKWANEVRLVTCVRVNLGIPAAHFGNAGDDGVLTVPPLPSRCPH